jgi:predicted membrane-bound spermidine synthase
MSRSLSPHRDLRTATAFFFLSGAAALVYQVAWQRLLGLTTGVAVHSVAIITAAFMAGLGIGSHYGGLYSARLSPRRSLIAFGVIELGVAAFAAVSVPFYHGLLYRNLSGLYDNMVLGTITHFVTLLPPTALMGMSLPFLVRGLVLSRAGAARTIGFLYGANALGASAGAILTPWVLLRYLGVTGAILVGAMGSLIAGLFAIMLARRRGEVEVEAAPIETAATNAAGPLEDEHEPVQSFERWVLLYAVSGFVSLSLEVIWFRVLDVGAKGGAFAFGTLLSIYLLGLASGTFVAARRAATIKRPLAVFLLCQIGIVLTTVLAHAVLILVPGSWPPISELVAYGRLSIGVHLPSADPGIFFLVFLFLPLVLFGPSTFLMGFGFPVLQRATQKDASSSGRTVGLLQAANIAGCTLGSLFTGLVLLDHVGTAGVFRTLTLISVAVAIFGFIALREVRFAALAGVLVITALLFPSNERLWYRLHGDPDPAGSLVEEDAASVTLLTPEADRYKLWINGRHNSWLPYGWLHTAIGALAAVSHKAPEDIAVIGLGSGDTAWASASRAETRHVVVFELASSQPALLHRIADLPTMGRVKEFLADPRVTIVKDDGRRRLHADGRQYDIIVADSVWTDVTMSNNLYSVEFYKLVKDSLKPGGVMCILAKTDRILAAVRRVFPYAVAFREDFLLVSSEPIVLDKELWLERLRSPRMVDYLGKGRTREVADFVRAAIYAPPMASLSDVNWDLQPKDEFLRPYSTARR